MASAQVISLDSHRLAVQLDQSIRAAAPLPWRLIPPPAPPHTLTLPQANAVLARWERLAAAAFHDVMVATGTGRMAEAWAVYEAAEAFEKAAERVRRKLLVARVVEEAGHVG